MASNSTSSGHHIKRRVFTFISLAALILSACTSDSPENNAQSPTASEDGQQMTTAGDQPATIEPEEPPTGTDISEADTGAITILEENVDGGPALTGNNPDAAGIHLRQFHAWSDPAEARSHLASLVFTDGGDRTAWADVLEQQGGVLVALFSGMQTSSGLVNSDIESIDTGDERLTLTVRTTVAGRCSADASLAAPYRIAHVAATAPEVLFREAIIPCTEEGSETIENSDISGISVRFLDDANVRIEWNPPANVDGQVRYDVLKSAYQGDILESTDQPSHTINDLVPGVIYTRRIETRRIEPVNIEGDTISTATSIAFMINAPSGAFRGLAAPEDLDRLKSQLAGNDAEDCGKFSSDGDSVIAGLEFDTTSQVSDCVIRALGEGRAFTADRTFIGEAFSFSSLVGDNMGNRWLLTQGNSDVLLENDFVPSASVYGGFLTGQVCTTPAVDLNIKDFTC